MVEIVEDACAEVDSDSLAAQVSRVCQRIPPLWDLHNFVAVNPFLGFVDRRFEETASLLAEGLGADILPGLEFYRKRWKEGAFGYTELMRATKRRGDDPERLAALLAGDHQPPRRPLRQILTLAERHDQAFGTDWDEQIGRSVARWCAVYVVGGGSSWGLPLAERGLYSSWLEAARVDRTLEIAGLRGWRTWANRLPDHRDEAISAVLARVPLPPQEREAYLYRLLGGLFGWASYLRRHAWEKREMEPGAVADLLAIRLCTDAAVAELARPTIPIHTQPEPLSVEDESIRLTLQEALEDGFVQTLFGKLAAPPSAGPSIRPLLQAIFCIDVRSEPLRRHLEEQSRDIQTLGFAGFFGIALDWQVEDCASARCPVLLRTGLRLRPATSAESATIGKELAHVQSAPGGSFTFVETLGLAYAIRLVGDAMATSPIEPTADGRDFFSIDPDGKGDGLTLEARRDLAAGILKHMGIRPPFARLVLLCGHEGQSANNPHAASLDCGACGGHGGAINARVAAAILNDPEVRVGLLDLAWEVPADTHFLPAVHNTSTDEVMLLDVGQVPPGHEPDLARLKDWLAQAGRGVRQERAIALGLDSRPASPLHRVLRQRVRDWSEVRPEWGLARNAAFIAARRARSHGANLEGRVFLHEYDAATDSDNSILTLILSAPMVVASWINLQYFASTVDNQVFGSGTKTLHNRVGTAGVVLGNGGDLRTGLAVQSVYAIDGSWFHEPLRLQVLVEAAPEQLDRVLADQRAVRQLVDNGWVRLFALAPDGNEIHKRTPGFGWEPVTDVQ